MLDGLALQEFDRQYVSSLHQDEGMGGASVFVC